MMKKIIAKASRHFTLIRTPIDQSTMSQIHIFPMLLSNKLLQAAEKLLTTRTKKKKRAPAHIRERIDRCAIKCKQIKSASLIYPK